MHTPPQQDSQDLARALIEEAADALFLFDPDNERLLDVSAAALRLTGYAREELLRLPASYLFRFEGKGGKERLRAAAQKSGVIHPQEGYLLRTRRDGVWIPVSLSVSRLHVRPRTLALFTARDVRAQRETHLHLEKLETELAQLTAAISDCLWSAEVGAGGWEYKYWSAAVEKVTGRPATFFFPGPNRWAEVVHPNDRQTWRDALARLRGGQAGQEEYRVVRPDGTVRWVRESVTASAREGRSLRLDAVVTDVTERRAAEEAARASDRRFRLLIEQAGDAIFVHDEQGRLLEVNQRACDSLGYMREELLRLTVADIFQTRPAECDMRSEKIEGLALPAAFSAPHAAVTEAGIHRRKDGSTFPVEVRIARLQPSAPSPVTGGGRLTLALARDVTERKRLEEQLRQAQKMEAVGRLAGGIAHDFNNLIQVITGCGEVVLGDLPLTHPSRDLVREMKHAGERAAALTRQLLAFSRQAVLAPKVLDLDAVIQETGQLLRRVIGEDIELATPPLRRDSEDGVTGSAASLTPGPKLGLVRADPNQLEQVLLNLAVNARDAMPRGGQLTIETHNVELDEAYARANPEARPGAYVLLAVSDTGAGMDAATRARVFEPFFSTKGEKGTGLGLATVYGIVRQSGGHVAVYSEPGKGTTFKLYLPRVDEAALYKEDGERGQERSGGLDSSGRLLPTAAPMETLLLVEDEDGVRGLAGHVLQGCGYKVLEANNGAEALRLAAAYGGRIDLLVTDVVMPQVGGRELAERLAVLRPQTKVLFLSGYTDDAIVRHGILEEEVAFLQKPFTTAALARRVREVLDCVRESMSP